MTSLACIVVEQQAPAPSGLDWASIATLLAAVLAAFIALVGYVIQRKITRRSERADLYANAIGAVESYLEGPYRIRRKTKDPNNWSALSSSLSDCKMAVSHHQALLRLHAPTEVAIKYDEFVTASKQDAGPKMTEAWGLPPLRRSTDVPIGAAYQRADTDAKRASLIESMSADLDKIGSWWRLRT